MRGQGTLTALRRRKGPRGGMARGKAAARVLRGLAGHALLVYPAFPPSAGPVGPAG